MIERRPVWFYSHGCRPYGDRDVAGNRPEDARVPALITSSGYVDGSVPTRQP
jgi:hypothetical protein